MKIKEINIIQFGKFKNRTWHFDDGMNVVIGDNESGKSTILAFIKFALYGVARKNPNVAVGERERAVSWNIGIAAGSLTLETDDGRLYRIERSGREGARGAYVDRARIIDLGSGEEVFAGEVPGEHFLGIGAQSYDSMCNIKQLECVALNGDAVKSVIDNLLSSGDENMNVQSAIKALDSERRRLLHANGKGGLVFESEIELEKLKSEHRGAIIFENECAKNRDELDRIELSLKKAGEEHELAQRLCDVHDDVLRLHKFDTLRELAESAETLKKEADELAKSTDFDIGKASFDNAARLASAKESLLRSKSAFEVAKTEADEANSALDGLNLRNEEGFSALIEEYGSPRSAVAFLSAKRKAKSNSLFFACALGAAGAVLLALAATVAFALQNGAGAATLAFLGVLFAVAGGYCYRNFRKASTEIKKFCAHLDSETEKTDEEKLLLELEQYSESVSRKARLSNSYESAKFRLSVASDTLSGDLLNARNMLGELGVRADNGDEICALDDISEKMRSYLSAKANLDEKMRENETLFSSLSRELERFSEKDLRAKITPAIEESVKNSSFDDLKIRRDNALKRVNQLNQYKAGIERNLASSGTRRTSTEIFPEIEAQEVYLAKQKLRLDAVKLAMETINSASLELKSDITPKIRERAEKNLSAMTDGKYNELFIDENMSLSVVAEGATRPVDALSRGSLDVAYFSVRLALLDTLLGNRKTPMYADEILSQLDDNRARAVMNALCEHAKDSQCILFTCQKRDLALAENCGDINVINLNSESGTN
ncbi:MAG: ATP-binding protein [Eubacteriales bacterium]